MAFAAAGYGFIHGLWPIAWIIVAAVFLYKLTVASGQFDIIRSRSSPSPTISVCRCYDWFSFGALLEGAAGSGAPVAFGALGVPILVAGQVTEIDPFHIGAMAGRQLPFLLVPCRSGW
ncbi:L-lactate permease [Shigella flexneri]